MRHGDFDRKKRQKIKNSKNYLEYVLVKWFSYDGWSISAEAFLLFFFVPGANGCLMCFRRQQNVTFFISVRDVLFEGHIAH